MERELIEITTILLFMLMAMASTFGLGWIFATIQHNQKQNRQVNYWRKHFINKCTECTQIKAHYAPKYSEKNKQWRCPRTGEFVSPKDIIPILLDEDISKHIL